MRATLCVCNSFFERLVNPTVKVAQKTNRLNFYWFETFCTIFWSIFKKDKTRFLGVHQGGSVRFHPVPASYIPIFGGGTRRVYDLATFRRS